MDANALFSDFKATAKDRAPVVMALAEYLELCRTDPMAYALPAERMVAAIGEPELVETKSDARLLRLFGNRTIKRYKPFADFYGMEERIEQIVSFYRHAAQGLEERKQVLYLLGPVGSAKSSLAETLKSLIQTYPIYVLVDGDTGERSPLLESPLGLFPPDLYGARFESQFGIDRRYLTGLLSPWAQKRLATYGNDLARFKVMRLYPSVLNQIAIAKTEPGDENNQDISALVGKVDIRKLDRLSQDDPDAYSYSGGLCLSNQGLLEFVEMFKAPIKVLNPLLTATQEGNFKGTEGFGAMPYQGLVLAHSNESEWKNFCDNKNNEAFLDRVYVVKIPYKSITEYRDLAGRNEGMAGLSTRFAYKLIAKAFDRDPTEVSADPVTLLKVIEESIGSSDVPPDMEKSLRARLREFLIPRYIDELQKEIQTAYLESYADYGQELFDRYVTFADFWMQEEGYVDPATGVAFDKSALNAELEKMEKPAGIANPKDFRHEVVNFVLRAQTKNGGQRPLWTSYQKLREVIEKRMFAATDDILPVVSFVAKSTAEEETKHKAFVDRMCARGHTPRQVRRQVEFWLMARRQ